MRVAVRKYLLWALLVSALLSFGYVLYQRANGSPPAASQAAGDGKGPRSLTSPDDIRSAVAGANVVLCVLDAMRADHVGCYGYPRETTPTIDRLASESLLFENHFCQFTSTKPSTASLMTGQHPDTHLVLNYRSTMESATTLEEALASAGFRTAIFSSNVKASPEFGVCLDFEYEFCMPELQAWTGPEEFWSSPEVLLRALDGWVEDNCGSQFFAYLHFLPPHAPYEQPAWATLEFQGLTPPTFVAGDFEFPVGEKLSPPETWEHPPLPNWVNHYDANLLYGDWAIAQVESLLREREILENTLLIVTSDHGEAFGEHGYLWHGRGIYDEVTHIPLLIRFPAGTVPALRMPSITQSIDVLPTLLDLFEVRCDTTGIQGRSLLPLVAQPTSQITPYAVTMAVGEPDKYMIRDLSHALLLYGKPKWRALYALVEDPGMRHNVLAQHPERAAEMIDAFRTFAGAQRRPPLHVLDPRYKRPSLATAAETALTPAMKDELRTLGYLK